MTTECGEGKAMSEFRGEDLAVHGLPGRRTRVLPRGLPEVDTPGEFEGVEKTPVVRHQ